ncbi:MAG: phage holin family protein [Nocardioidaceae bacterium]
MSSAYESDYTTADVPADNGGASAATSPYPDVSDQSVGSLVGQLSSDFSKLMRMELALAKAEMREEVKKAGAGAGLLGGAGLAGWMALICGSFALIWILDIALPLPWAAVIVTLLWAIVAAVLAVMGRKKLQEVNPKPEQTVQSLKEDKEWVKAQKN